MPVTQTWDVDRLDCSASQSGKTNVVTVVYWKLTATYGSCGFGNGTPSIPYANVTQQEVLDWCWANGVDKDATEANCAQQNDLQQNPVRAVGVPWT